MKEKKVQGVQLKVAEAIQDDVNKGIVRVDSNILKEAGLKPGDIVEIEGERVSVGIVDRAYPGDIGLSIIRMDGIFRKNVRTSIGEMVNIRKAKVQEAKKVLIAPAQKGVIIKAAPTYFKRELLGRAMIKGDIVVLGGTKTRRQTLSESAFEDIFNFMEESMIGGFGFTNIKFVVATTNPKGPVIITDATDIEYNPEAVELKEEEAYPEVSYEDIGGLEEEVRKIREMVELPLKHPEVFERLGIQPPKGVLLHGPPGTGKTLLAKAVANETSSQFLTINGPEIMSKYYGQSEENIRKIFEEAEKNAPSIIFIDEIDAIAPKREETRGEVERRVVAQLLSLMDGLKSRGKVVVIAATNITDVLDPALRRPGRFDREIEIAVPDKVGRKNILQIHTRNMPLARDVKLDYLANITYGFVGADLESLAKEAAMALIKRLMPQLRLHEEEAISEELLQKLVIKMDDFKEALKTVRPSALREVLVEIPNVTWEDVGGLDDVKQELKEAVEWPLKNPGVFKTMGIRPPRGILLYGAPGTGKTMLAKAVAKESDSNFILVKGPEMLSKWVGESEKAVREIFKKARQTAPTIIFFDEVDSIAPRRGISTDAHVTESVVNQILTEMDGLEELHDVVVIAATNRPDMIDTGLLRPGRFDRIILTPAPEKKSREAIFKIHTKEMPLKAVSIPKLVDETEGYVGADIEAICREAAMLALRKDMKAKNVTMKEFEEAMQKVRPSVTKEIEKSYEELKDAFSRARAKQMEKEKPEYFG